MSICYKVPDSVCNFDSKCSDWGCYCERHGSFGGAECVCQPKKAIIAGVVLMSLAACLFVFLLIKWTSWPFDANAPRNDVNKCKKMWGASICAGMMASGLVCIGIGMDPLNRPVSQDRRFACTVSDGDLIAAIFGMLVGFWGIGAIISCCFLRMCSAGCQGCCESYWGSLGAAGSTGHRLQVYELQPQGYVQQQGYAQQAPQPPPGYSVQNPPAPLQAGHASVEVALPPYSNTFQNAGRVEQPRWGERTATRLLGFGFLQTPARPNA
eukprot:m.134039 g.134039  ORF g.134039 m.134039 type:complete len:267 (+) comp52440_c0_seq2:77-877(+)